MKILVCISKTPDTTSKISFDSSGKKFIEEGIQYILNPYDEWYALVRAIELKEQLGGEVHAIHVGSGSSDMVIRKALAIGADIAFRIDAEPIDSQFTSTQIAAFAKDKSYDLILLGKETIDYNGSEVGSMLAAMLDMTYLSYANKLELDGQKATAHLEVEGGVEVVETNLPCVISAAKGMAEQRIPNMKGIMDAKKKPLEVLSPVPYTPTVEYIQFILPPSKTQVEMIAADDIDRLVSILKDDLKLF
ncbi:MAG: electron transfer flavoprotein subunit beta/FixA family protein [Saprospiraceae bacterium]|nr:electron transfer flavoprotein subunit beta/FixA family protein [Saprospiraceae bacterium]